MSIATSLIQRSYGQIKDPNQWVREVLENSRESKANRVEFGVEWQGVEKEGVYRRKISDNGEGMSADQLFDYFKTVGESGKDTKFSISDEDSSKHGNFGIGCRIALLPWNKEGVVYISYKDGKGSMLWMFFDRETQVYSLKKWMDEVDGPTEVIDVNSVTWSKALDSVSYGIDWSEVAPEWVRNSSGTCIVLFGNNRKCDSFIQGSSTLDEKTGPKAVTQYINTRFFDLKGIEVKSVEFNFKEKEKLPKTEHGKEDGFSSLIKGLDRTARGTRRDCKGAKYYFGSEEDVKSGEFLIDNERVKIIWFYNDGKLLKNKPYSSGIGYIALKYKNELFKMGNTSSEILTGFRNFGLSIAKVRECVTILVEPNLYSSSTDWGVHPSSERSGLFFTGNGFKSITPPVDDWGHLFVDRMPDKIRDAIIKNTASIAEDGTSDDHNAKKLMGKFGLRWKNSVTILTHSSPKKGKLTNGEISYYEDVAENEDTTGTLGGDVGGTDGGTGGGKQGGGNGGGGTGEGRSGGSGGTGEEKETTGKQGGTKTGEEGGNSGSKKIEVLRKKVDPESAGDSPYKNITTDMSLPECLVCGSNDIGGDDYVLSYQENHATIKGPVVLLNIESSFIKESFKNYKNRYHPVHQDTVHTIVLQCYKTIARCKLAHALLLQKKVGKVEMKSKWLTPESLTLSVMGLVSEDAYISQRLIHIKKF